MVCYRIADRLQLYVLYPNVGKSISPRFKYESIK